MNDDSSRIRITDDDLKDVRVDAPWPGISPPAEAPGGVRQWGNISGAGPAGAPVMGAGGGSFFLKSWVYLGLAGLIGAFLAWAVCEPAYADFGILRWGNNFIIPLLITALCVGFAAVESLVERSAQKAILRGFLALVLGLVLGFLFDYLSNIIYRFGLQTLARSGAAMVNMNPSLWLVRAISWMIFGVTSGIVYGIAGRSGKKCLYGILGGMLGAGLGGFLFNPISNLTGGGGASRCIGMMIFGASTGLAIGLVESALKNRWLYVSGGPLAGKQFILYKPLTQLGSQQTNDIYLFKDLTIAPVHATIQLQGSQATLFATGATFIGGQPVSQRALRGGDVIQIGRYTFQYQERAAQG